MINQLLQQLALIFSPFISSLFSLSLFPSIPTLLTCTHMYMYMYMYLKHEINVHVLSTIGMHYHQKMATIEADREVNTLRCTKQSKKATV